MSNIARNKTSVFLFILGLALAFSTQALADPTEANLKRVLKNSTIKGIVLIGENGKITPINTNGKEIKATPNTNTDTSKPQVEIITNSPIASPQGGMKTMGARRCCGSAGGILVCWSC